MVEATAPAAVATSVMNITAMQLIDPTMQCEPANVMTMLVFLVALIGSAFVRQNTAATLACAGVAMLATIHALVFREIKELTLAHLMVGSIAVEGAIRVARAPFLAFGTWPELAFGALAIFPNLMVTLTETCCPNSGHSIYFGLRTFEEYRHNKFFSKQHAFLHAALVIMLSSICSSFWPKLRRSPRAQMARLFIEPSCLVAVAMILMTHDHGASTANAHDLDSHPVIGSLMCLAAFCHTVTSAVHLSYPSPTGAPPDLTVPLPGGGPAPLRILRLTTCFAYLLLANFLFVDTFMEYLGCRMVLVKVGGDTDTARIGWKPATEMSTYESAAVLTAVLTLAFVIVPLVGDGPAANGVEGAAAYGTPSEKHTLLPLAHVHVEDGEDIKVRSALATSCTRLTLHARLHAGGQEGRVGGLGGGLSLSADGAGRQVNYCERRARSRGRNWRAGAGSGVPGLKHRVRHSDLRPRPVQYGGAVMESCAVWQEGGGYCAPSSAPNLQHRGR